MGGRFASGFKATAMLLLRREMKSLQMPTPIPDKAIYKPRPPGSEIETRKAKFDKLNKFVTHRCGWLTSVPGAAEVIVEVLPGSGLPAELKAAGYSLVPDGEGERILPAAIVQEFTLTSSGAYELATAESTKPVAQVLRHAGIVKVQRYSFGLG